MSRLFRTALFVGGLLLLSTGGGLAPSLASAGAPPVEAAPAERASVDSGSAEITFPTPKRFAVVQQATGKIMRIYTDGDVLPQATASERPVLVQRVILEGMVVRDTRTGREHLVRLGEPVPASPGTTFVGTVLLTQVEYRFREVNHVTDAEPVLILLADTAAILEQQVPGGPSAPSPPPRISLRPRPSVSPPVIPPRPSPPTVFSKIRVNQVDEDNFIVEGETLRPAIEEVGKTLSLMMPHFRATPSGLPAMGLNISSAAGTGTLDAQGFTVTSLKVAQGLGVQVGDTIVSLNGHRVNSPLSAWRIFHNLFVENHYRRTELRVQIHRNGARLNKTYLIR
ncbi:MAG: hypothetical protein V3S25_03455 [Nitrospirales bacterium]